MVHLLMILPAVMAGDITAKVPIFLAGAAIAAAMHPVNGSMPRLT